jgi:large subunit ribosomal protein L14
MIYPKTKLLVADNTGAKLAECIRSSQNNSTYASVGQVITVSIKSVSSSAKVKKGDVHKAVIVRVKKPILRRSGHVIYFNDNAIVLLKDDSNTSISTIIL